MNEEHPTSNSDPFRRTTQGKTQRDLGYIRPMSEVAFRNIIDTSKWPAPEPFNRPYGEGGLDKIAKQLGRKEQPTAEKQT